jgi:hypothetical protein
MTPVTIARKLGDRAKAAKKRARLAKRQRHAELAIKDCAARDAVFERDRFKCVGPPRLGLERCGKQTGLSWCHVLSRRYKETRHLIENGLCMCMGCHLAWHSSPLESGIWFTVSYPERRAILLEARKA